MSGADRGTSHSSAFVSPATRSALKLAAPVAVVLGTAQSLLSSVSGAEFTIGDITFFIGLAGFGAFWGVAPAAILFHGRTDDYRLNVYTAIAAGAGVVLVFLLGHTDSADYRVHERFLLRVIGVVLVAAAVYAYRLEKLKDRRPGVASWATDLLWAAPFGLPLCFIVGLLIEPVTGLPPPFEWFR
jgi:hypothetical protein